MLIEKGSLGDSSLYVFNRALMCKWVWRFTTQKNLLWTRVIKAIHGEDGENGSRFKVGYKSIWRSILQEVETLKIKGIHLNNFMQKKLGNGADTYFWEDLWHGDMVLKQRYPRLYALEVKKTVDVASKLSQENLTWSFRRAPRSGVEQDQLTDLTTYVEGVVLGVTPDRWYWTLDGSGEFSVASARKVIDDNRFPEVSTQTRWIKAVPIKVNIHAWKVRMDCLPTRLNISRRGIDIPSILCPVCGSVTESSSHLFFDCLVAKDNFRKICRWWEVDFMEVHTFDEWVSWIVNLRIPIKHKRLLEGLGGTGVMRSLREDTCQVNSVRFGLVGVGYGRPVGSSSPGGASVDCVLTNSGKRCFEMHIIQTTWRVDADINKDWWRGGGCED
ncbi:RNA-directed DNA polymerase, eukaryota, reverse transcriptase zinc-binding domain protein [Tanacetum coccineum]